MYRKYLKKQSGFTLVEMIIAITLLLLVALSFIPMFVFISEASQNKRVRLIALKLASSKIEEIRALPYDQVGTVEGNPKGVIPQEEKVDIEGIEFTVKTRIWWVDDPSDNDASGHDPLPYDYKKVQVTVTSPSLFTGEVVKTADISTLVAKEGEDKILSGGNLKVLVERGYYFTPGQEKMEGVKIDLVKKNSPGTIQTAWTDYKGEILFAALDEGPYIVKPDVGIQGMMVKPTDVEKEVDVVERVTQNCIITVEYPCYLEIKLVEKGTDKPIKAEGKLKLSTSDMELPPIDFTTDNNGIISSDTIGELWPAFGDAYDVTVSVDGYFVYRLKNDRNPPWNGTFTEPKQKKVITIKLTPTKDTASVTVTDDIDHGPVEGATVDVYEHEYIYRNGSWVESTCQPVASAITDTSGIATFALSDSLSEPENPKEGDRYTSYCVRISRDGYKDKEIHGAFLVIGGQQISSDGVIETYKVQLEPYVGSLRVEVRYWYMIFWWWDYWLVDNATVKVEGPVNAEGQTNDNGVAVFENLNYGKYDVTVSFNYNGIRTITQSVTIDQEVNELIFNFNRD